MILVSVANRHDSKMFERCVDAIPAISGLAGRPRKRPSKLHADKGYDYKRCRAHLRQRGIASRIAKRGVESSERLGKHRWVVEHTHGWFAGFGKLRIRFERRLDIHEALLKLAEAIICARFVDRWFLLVMPLLSSERRTRMHTISTLGSLCPQRQSLAACTCRRVCPFFFRRLGQDVPVVGARHTAHVCHQDLLQRARLYGLDWQLSLQVVFIAEKWEFGFLPPGVSITVSSEASKMFCR